MCRVWQPVSQRLEINGLFAAAIHPPPSFPSSLSCLGACCGRWQASCGSFIKICKQFRSIKTLEIIQRQVRLQPRPLICTRTHTHTQMKMIFTRNFSIIFATFETLEYFAIFNGQCKWMRGGERERGKGVGGCTAATVRRGEAAREINRQGRAPVRQRTHWERIYLSLITRCCRWGRQSDWPGLAWRGLFWPARWALYNFHMQPQKPLKNFTWLRHTHTDTHTETGIYKYENGIAVSRQRKALPGKGVGEGEVVAVDGHLRRQVQQRQLLLITCMRSLLSLSSVMRGVCVIYAQDTRRSLVRRCFHLISCFNFQAINARCNSRGKHARTHTHTQRVEAVK